MLANGVVMFQDPASQGFQNWNNNDKGWCCDGQSWTNSSFWNTQRQGRYSYAIAPFWTDLIQKDSDGGFFSETDSSSTKYWWHKIEEYNNQNENSFSLEIFPDGNYKMEYGDLSISNHSILIGVAGDLTKGELVAHEYHDTTGQNYIYSGTTMSHNGNDLVCSYDALSDPTCAGYETAYFDQQCGLDALYDPQCSGYQVALTEKCIQNPYYVDCPQDNLGFNDNEQDFGITNTGFDDNEEDFGMEEENFGLTEEDFMVDTQEEEQVYGEPNTESMAQQSNEDLYESESGVVGETRELQPVEEIQSAPVVVQEEREIRPTPQVVEEEREVPTVVAKDDDKKLEEITEIGPEETILVERKGPDRDLILNIALKEVVSAQRIAQISENDRKTEEKERKKDIKSAQSSQSSQNLQNSGQNSSGGGSFGAGQSQISITSADFFSSDTQIYQMMSGVQVSSDSEVEERAQTQTIQQEEQQIQQNLALGEAAPIGVTIIPVETITIMEDAPQPTTLAEKISVQIAEKKREQSNEAAIGQTEALTELSQGVNLDVYSNMTLGGRDFYESDQSIFAGSMPDNATGHYRMFNSSYGTHRELIRSQYK
jgi:phosphohistidine swiveling domain-containing protein